MVNGLNNLNGLTAASTACPICRFAGPVGFCYTVFTREKTLRRTIQDTSGSQVGGQPDPSWRTTAVTITDEIRGLWRELMPTTQIRSSTQLGTDKPKPSGKHRADTTCRPYAPVGRTGRRIYRPPSHRA